MLNLKASAPAQYDAIVSQGAEQFDGTIEELTAWRESISHIANLRSEPDFQTRMYLAAAIDESTGKSFKNISFLIRTKYEDVAGTVYIAGDGITLNLSSLAEYVDRLELDIRRKKEEIDANHSDS